MKHRPKEKATIRHQHHPRSLIEFLGSEKILSTVKSAAQSSNQAPGTHFRHNIARMQIYLPQNPITIPQIPGQLQHSHTSNDALAIQGSNSGTMDTAQGPETPDPLQRKLAETTHAMWSNHVLAAYVCAVLQWAHKNRQKQKTQRKRQENSPPSTLESYYEGIHKQAAARFTDIAKQREGLLAASNNAVDAIPKHPSREQVKTLRSLLIYIQQDLDDALLTRTLTNSYIDLTKFPKKAQQEEQFGIASDNALSMNNVTNEPDRTSAHLTSPTATSDREIEDAKDRLDSAAITRDQALFSHLPDELTVLEELEEQDRWDIFHLSLLNIGSTFPFPETSGYDSYSKVYDPEVSRVKLLQAYSKHSSTVVANIQEMLGIEFSSIGTYKGHDEGAYDVHAPHGTRIKANAPQRLDLTRQFQTAPHIAGIYKLINSRIVSVIPSRPEWDFVQKLAYGICGRTFKGREAITGECRTADPNSHSLSSDRIIAALTFEGAFKHNDTSMPEDANASVLANVEERKHELLDMMQSALRAELQMRGIYIPDNINVLKNVKLDSEQNFESLIASAITDEVVGQFLLRNVEYEDISEWAGAIMEPFSKGFMSSKERKRAEAKEKKRARATEKAKREARKVAKAAIRQAVEKIAKNNTGLREIAMELIADIVSTIPEELGLRSGASVTVRHEYHHEASGQLLPIHVAYRHLSEIERGLKVGAIKLGSNIGKVGVSGNAVSPHVHMSVGVKLKLKVPVKEKNIKGKADQPDVAHIDRDFTIAYLSPLDFFCSEL